MIHRGLWGGVPLIITSRPGCLILSIGDPGDSRVITFDLAGRLWTLYHANVTYRRGLDGRILARQRLPGEQRLRWWLSAAEAARIEETARSIAGDIAAALETGCLAVEPPPRLPVLLALKAAASFDSTASRADADAYAAIYRPVGILPPDRYLSIVLQLTEGCSFNTCTFCSFYRDTPFRIKKPAELREHAQAVQDFLGAGISLRRTLFLADANALTTPMAMLIPLLETIRGVFDVESLGGMYSFLDGFSGEKKSVDDYRTLHQLGLRRVYVGLESGHGGLLDFLRKPGTPGDAVTSVSRMKQAGLGVGIIVLLGAGGRQFSAAHVEETIAVLRAMSLRKGDILYLSEIIFTPDLPYAQAAVEANLIPLTHAECMAQGEQIAQAVRAGSRSDGPVISRYDIRDFVY